MNRPVEPAPEKAPTIGLGIVMIWLVAAFALGATIFVVAGWRTVTQVWLWSGAGLAVLLLPEIIRERRKPASPLPSEEASPAA